MRFLRTWHFWFGCAVSLVCLWLAFRDVQLVDLAHLMGSVSYPWLLAALVSELIGITARAQRWLVVLDKSDGLADSFWAQNIGFLFTNVLPMRLGEPARVLVMSERRGIPVMQVAATAIVERILDAATNVLVLVLVLPWMQVPTLIARAGVFFGVMVLIALAAVLLMVRFGPQSERLLQSVCRSFPFLPCERITRYWRELVTGFLPLTRWRIALRASLLSLVCWAMSIAMYWSVLRAFQPDARIVEGAFMMAALSFAVAIPSSPGFVGVFQWIGQQALVLPFGSKYSPGSALAITLTAHVTYYVFTTALGIIALWRMGESFANLGRMIMPKRSTGEKPLAEAAH